MREDKRQNRVVIEWLRRVDPDRPFLYVDGDVWTYGQTLAGVEARLTSDPRVVRPRLDVESILDLLAGLAGGGVTVVAAGVETRANPGRLVVYTSGSTAAPRGVRLTDRNLEAAARASMKHLGHGPDDNWLLAMPLHHVGGLSIIVRQVYAGGSVTVLDRFDPAGFASALAGRVTLASVVPTMLRRIIPYGPYSGLRAVLVGGGPIPEGLLEEAAAVGLPVLPTYGMTETFGQVATLRPDASLERKVHPLPGVELTIDNGRIAVRGEQVSPGYVGEPDRDDSWLITNDLGDIDDEGALRVIGRADAVIVSGGENVNPETIEEVLRQHPDVDDVVVVGVDDDEWGQRVVCLYVGELTPGDLVEWSVGRLKGHMLPKEWRRVDSIPRISIDKPDRTAAARLLLWRP